MQTPGELLRALRQKHGLTQARLAELLKTTTNYVARVERSERIPSEQFMAHVQLLDWVLTVNKELPKIPDHDIIPISSWITLLENLF